MSYKRIIMCTLALSFICFSLGNIASAQVVDPCGYGCPKEGCPKCDKGGPIPKAQDKQAGGDIDKAGAAKTDQGKPKKDENSRQK